MIGAFLLAAGLGLALEATPVNTLESLRDRVLIAVMTDTIARMSAVVSLRVEDYHYHGKRHWVRLHEKGPTSTRCRCITGPRNTWTRTSRPPG